MADADGAVAAAAAVAVVQLHNLLYDRITYDR